MKDEHVTDHLHLSNWRRHDLLWIIIGQTIAFLGAVTAVKVFTAQLGPKGYGELALILAVAALVNAVLHNPAAQVALRFYPIVNDEGSFRQAYSLFRRFLLLSSSVLFIVALIVGGLFALSSMDSRWCLLIVGAVTYAVIHGLNVILLSLDTARLNRRRVALNQILDIGLKIGVALALVIGLRADAIYVLLGYAIGTGLTFLLFHRNLASDWPHKSAMRPTIGAEMLRYGAPLAVFSVLAAVGSVSDRWILEAALGSREVGIYYALFQIAHAPTNVINSLLNALFVPVIFQRAQTAMRTSESMLGWIALLNVAALLPFIGIVIVYHSVAVEILTTSEFAEESHLLIWLVLGALMSSLANVLSIRGLVHRRPGIYAIPKVVHIVSFVALGIILVMQFGLIGMAIAFGISAVIYFFGITIANTIALGQRGLKVT